MLTRTGNQEHQARWFMFMIQALGRQKQNHSNFKSSLGYMVKWSQKQTKQQKHKGEKRWEEKSWWTQWLPRRFPTPYHRPRWGSAPHLSAGLALVPSHCWSEGQTWYSCRYWSKLCHAGKNRSAQSPSFSCRETRSSSAHISPTRAMRTEGWWGQSAEFMVEIRGAQYLKSSNCENSNWNYQMFIGPAHIDHYFSSELPQQALD